MSLDWTHQFCLACDKQTDGATYCSESCRLADYEKISSTSSGASSPALPSQSPWTSFKPVSPPTKFYLSPAYDFSNAQPCSSTSTRSQTGSAQPNPSRVLSPSSSHSSLCSMRSSASSDAGQLSERAKKELHAYASSFEQVRLQRRRSY